MLFPSSSDKGKSVWFVEFEDLIQLDESKAYVPGRSYDKSVAYFLKQDNSFGILYESFSEQISVLSRYGAGSASFLVTTMML